MQIIAALELTSDWKCRYSTGKSSTRPISWGPVGFVLANLKALYTNKSRAESESTEKKT